MTSPSSNIVTRRLLPVDVEPFIALRHHGLIAHPDIFLQIYEEERYRPKNWHVGLINDNLTIGAFENDRLIGCTMLNVLPATKNKHKGYVWGIYVYPECRRTGAAIQMQETMFEECQKLGVKVLISVVLANNEPALKMHYKVGYEYAYTELDGIRQLDGSFNDLIHMVKYL